MASAVTQLNEVRIRQLDRMLDAERRMRAIAEQQADAARPVLCRVPQQDPWVQSRSVRCRLRRRRAASLIFLRRLTDGFM